jgi:hypothetical protein
MNYIINQPRGIGDIIFIEPILRHLYNNGENKIILPAAPQYTWIAEYIDYVEFPSMNDFKIDYESTYMGLINNNTYQIPMRFAMPIVRKLAPHDYSNQYNTMLDKYRLLNLNIDLWKTIKLKHNTEKENLLYKQLVKSDEYLLINNNYSGGEISINTNNNNLPIVYMNNIPGFTLIDWSKIIINAKEIHSVSTSNLFLIETLNIKTDIVHIYNRPSDKNLDGIKEFVNPNFILHE